MAMLFSVRVNESSVLVGASFTAVMEMVAVPNTELGPLWSATLKVKLTVSILLAPGANTNVPSGFTVSVPCAGLPICAKTIESPSLSTPSKRPEYVTSSTVT